MTHGLTIFLALSMLAMLSCGEASGEERSEVVSLARITAPARPDACVEVRAGAPLQPSVDAARQGSALCLAPGVHRGPVHVTRPITIWGTRDAIIRTNGEGTTVLVEADDSALLGVTVDGSGARYDTEDSAVKVKGADGARIEGVRVVNAVFGILAERTNRTVIRGNEVAGNPRTTRGMRGDGIRLWETRDSVVDSNLVRHSRDVVVWYSPRNRVTGNTVEHGRYGTHFMYSGENVVHDNVFRSNAVGVFVMYSRGVELERNLFLDAHGPSGMGIGLKESGNVVVRDNHFVHNAKGIYIDTSPLAVGDEDVFEDNRIELSDVAIAFHGRASGNVFRRNELASNRAQVVVEGGGDALEARFSGNRYDDYVGYDLDADGTGDVAYEIRSLSSQITSSHPNVGYFAGTPALAVVDAMGKIVPLFAPRTVMRDAEPAFAPIVRSVTSEEVARAN